jgi:hypothetical protein
LQIRKGNTTGLTPPPRRISGADSGPKCVSQFSFSSRQLVALMRCEDRNWTKADTGAIGGFPLRLERGLAPFGKWRKEFGRAESL